MIQTVELLFVYGTLKKGGRLHDYIAHCPFIGNGMVPTHTLLDLTRGAFPHMVKSEHRDDAVFGEVYMVNAETMAELDHIERGYTPINVPVYIFPAEEPVHIRAYVYQRASPDEIEKAVRGRVSWVPGYTLERYDGE